MKGSFSHTLLLSSDCSVFILANQMCVFLIVFFFPSYCRFFFVEKERQRKRNFINIACNLTGNGAIIMK